jgi:predicted phosphodiesterase
MSRKHDIERVFLIPDTHRPYHDKRAWKVALEAAATFFDPVPPKRRRVVVLGDFADYFQVSFHGNDPRGRMPFVDEVADVNVGLDEIDALGAKHNDFVEGNHEYRINRYLVEKAPALLGLKGTTTRELFRLDERGWNYTPYRQYTRIGKVYVTHDHGAAGKTAAEKARQQFGHNVVIGHTHRMASAYQGNAAGEQHVGHMFGWLGDVDSINYEHRVKALEWTHGFGIGLHDLSTGDIHMHGCPIVNGVTFVLGQKVAA